MGMSVEQNWYLVVQNEDSVEYRFCHVHELQHLAYTEKEGYRTYPLNAPLPLIFKEEGICVGMAEIRTLTMEEGKTLLYFEYTKPMDKLDPIAQHYYNSYKEMKEGKANEVR